MTRVPTLAALVGVVALAATPAPALAKAKHHKKVHHKAHHHKKKHKHRVVGPGY